MNETTALSPNKRISMSVALLWSILLGVIGATWQLASINNELQTIAKDMRSTKAQVAYLMALHPGTPTPPAFGDDQ